MPQFFGILALLHVAFLSVLVHRNHDEGILGLIKLLLLFDLCYFVVLGASITIYWLSSTYCKCTRGPILGKLGEFHLSHICGLGEVINILRLFARNTETLYDMVQKKLSSIEPEDVTFFHGQNAFQLTRDHGTMATPDGRATTPWSCPAHGM
jgi:hypothetical protein